MSHLDQSYAFFYQRVLSPLHEGVLKRRKTLAYRTLLEASQWWPPERLRAFQRDELRTLLAHAARSVPFWQARFKACGMTDRDIEQDESLWKLPVITKQEIRAHAEEMVSTQFSGKTWSKATGGSTGIPLQFEYTPESYAWRMATTKRGYGWAGCDDGLKQAYLWGGAVGRVPLWKRLKEQLHHHLERKRYFNCFDFDEERMTQYLRMLNRYQPEVIVGYTNPLYHFAEFVSRVGGIHFSPKAVITGAEALHAFQRDLMRRVFGCPVFNTYGSREFMLIASECEAHRGLHVSAENLLVEILRDDGSPAKPGEMGRVVVTDLHNYGMPFIRYELGDLGVVSDAPCPCGRGLPLLAEVVGRSLDMIKAPDGRLVPGEFFPHLLKEFRGVRQFQVVQDRVDRLTVRLVTDGSFEEGQLETIRREVHKTVGGSLQVEFAFVDQIPLTATGKFRVTVSELN